jgi:F0F1-type ATP synthase membrane subunit c/vacuolar-type H+-ATPase subunit K
MNEIMISAKAAAAIAVAITIGIGILGPSFAQGLIGSKACENIGKYPEGANNIFKTMSFALVMAETLALFIVFIAAALIYFGMR